jgi:hypothetical protein
MNVNRKYLEEAVRLEAAWEKSGLIKGLKLMCRPGEVLLESVRLRNEFNGTDEEHQAYLNEFGDRMQKATEFFQNRTMNQQESQNGKR